MLGCGKGGPLFEEAVTMNVVRLLKGAIEDHPILVAYKELARPDTAVFAATIAAAQAATSVRKRGRISFSVSVTNTGNQMWRVTPDSPNHVRLGVQLLDGDLKLVDRDYHRESLIAPFLPGQQRTIRVDCPAPNEAGRYGFKIDLVQESVAWFETRGSTPAIWRFDVVE